MTWDGINLQKHSSSLSLFSVVLFLSNCTGGNFCYSPSYKGASRMNFHWISWTSLCVWNARNPKYKTNKKLFLSWQTWPKLNVNGSFADKLQKTYLRASTRFLFRGSGLPNLRMESLWITNYPLPRCIPIYLMFCCWYYTNMHSRQLWQVLQSLTNKEISLGCIGETKAQ